MVLTVVDNAGAEVSPMCCVCSANESFCTNRIRDPSRIDRIARRCIIAGMFGFFKGCRLARMSSGRYCLVRDLGLVKGGKGMRHHEVVVAFSVRDLLGWLRKPSARRFEPDTNADFLPGTNP
jgi:hypothetical protein